MKWTRKGRQFDEIFAAAGGPATRFYIWGAGVMGASFCDMFREELKLLGYIDSNPQKQGTVQNGLSVFSPQVLENKAPNVKIVVATGWITEVFGELERMGYRRNIDFFDAPTFTSAYMYGKYGKVYVQQVNVLTTERCTLKCEKCMAFIPYVAEPKHLSMEAFQKSLSLYFRWVDKVGVFGFGGGDAMLNPRLKEMISYLGETYYPERITDIELYTNAVLLPDGELLALLKKYHVIVRFTDYGAEVKTQKTRQMLNLLEENGIRKEYVKFERWYDIGFDRGFSAPVRETGVEEFFDRCGTICRSLAGDKLWFCNVNRSAVCADRCAPDANDYFDLSDYSEERKAAFIEFNSGYTDLGYLTFCRFCDGNQNVNHKFVVPGRQLGGVR